MGNVLSRVVAPLCALAALLGCDVQDRVLPNVETGPANPISGGGGNGSGGATASGGMAAGGLGGGGVGAGGMGSGGATATGGMGGGGVIGGGGTPGGGLAADPDCDMNGFWAVRQLAVAEALGLQQCASTYYLFELRQEGTAVEVVSHLNCGTEARGSANATFNMATRRALLAANAQVGRAGTMRKEGGQCVLQMEPFWTVLGADEATYAPMPRNSSEPFSVVQNGNPLPKDAAGAIDFDGNGYPGLAIRISVAINGVRHAVLRSVDSWTTNDRYTITPAVDWPDDLHVRLAFYSEEYPIETEPAGDALLRSGSNMVPNAPAARVTLRFLGRTLSDPRAAAVIAAARPDDVEGALQTCKAIAEALPPVVPLGFPDPQVCPCVGGGRCQ